MQYNIAIFRIEYRNNILYKYINMETLEQDALDTQLSRFELQDIRRAFELFDTEKKGKILARDLHDVLRQISNDGNAPVEGALVALQALPDDHLMSMDEFVQLVVQRGGPDDNRDEHRRIFDMFDTNGKGYLGVNDLRAVSTDLGESMTNEELEEMISRASQSGGDHVTFDEFVSIMTKKLFS
ncbi:hypothetical protein MPSEU_000215400 [Mayamaea pseudoterrestris]|nr:hypothetical protein MPSEU_000215400 [Mayamaea pseudoterrestris]